jgi:2-keto-4-pentenoate hydratase/2-oxohepta-3-ene-1,7-dioic acid hydratase in catechol pathway
VRLCRFSSSGTDEVLSGVIKGEDVFALKGEDTLGSLKDHEVLERRESGESFSLDEVNLLPPVLPSKIIAIGLIYKAHAAEFNLDIPTEPMLFMKPVSAIIGHGDEIIYPSHMSRRVDYEAELAIVIGRRTKDVATADAADYILGYTCFNDVTARDLQGRDKQYMRSKGFDTFAPIGPWIETELPDPTNVRVESYLNSEKRQDTSTADMIFNVYELVSFISKVMTLLPGDVIATGTPSGIGKMKPGDEVEVRIAGIGSLINKVK